MHGTWQVQSEIRNYSLAETGQLTAPESKGRIPPQRVLARQGGRGESRSLLAVLPTGATAEDPQQARREPDHRGERHQCHRRHEDEQEGFVVHAAQLAPRGGSGHEPPYAPLPLEIALKLDWREVRFPNATIAKGLPMAEKLQYTVARGSKAGVLLTPHRYADGTFRAHRTNSRTDPEGRKVLTEAELIPLVRSGYHVRMSNLAKNHPPSTVKPLIVNS